LVGRERKEQNRLVLPKRSRQYFVPFRIKIKGKRRRGQGREWPERPR